MILALSPVFILAAPRTHPWRPRSAIATLQVCTCTLSSSSTGELPYLNSISHKSRGASRSQNVSLLYWPKVSLVSSSEWALRIEPHNILTKKYFYEEGHLSCLPICPNWCEKKLSNYRKSINHAKSQVCLFLISFLDSNSSQHPFRWQKRIMSTAWILSQP